MITVLRGLANKRTLFVCAVLAALFGFWLFLPKPPLLEGIPFSQCVRDRNGQLLDITLTPDQKFRTWAPLEDISPHLVQATLRYEDKYYRQHPGINPVALARSVYQIALHSQGRTGGSTITMQLARLRFHLRTRTFSGKGMQMLRALELERHYSKSDILEAYLNLAPYGGNIEGAGAASQIYFGKEPSKLTGPEAVVLSVIPQSPTKRALRSDRPNDGVMLAQNRWYDRTHIENDAELSARSFEARATDARKRFAPHFVREILEARTPGAKLPLPASKASSARLWIWRNKAASTDASPPTSKETVLTESKTLPSSWSTAGRWTCSRRSARRIFQTCKFTARSTARAAADRPGRPSSPSCTRSPWSKA